MVSGSRCLKMAASLLGVAASVIAVLGLFGSCNNPFVSDLGEQVVIGRPTVTINYPPPNAILSREVRFTGDAWAHRELRRVEVRIGRITTADQMEGGRVFGYEGNRILDWTNIQELRYGSLVYTDDPTDGVDGTWEFVFDTGHITRYFGDGVFRMRVRVSDNTEDARGWEGPVYSTEIVYNVINLPSGLRMTVPSDATITDATEPIRLASGIPIQGQIDDRRGLAPGYPMIQIWPVYRMDITADPEAFANNNRFGWASMFLLDPVAGIMDDAEEGTGYYAWRGEGTDPVEFASFSFLLRDFAITLPPRGDGVRAAVFGSDELRADYYFFRIRTRSNRGVVGYFPPHNHGNDDLEDPFRPGDPVKIFLINNAAPPIVELHPGPNLTGGPSLYVTTGINERKLALLDGRPEREIFRLRTLARHSDGIYSATLRWEHPATGRGVRGEDPLYPRSLELNVHYDEDDREVFFTFTADGSHRDIFTTHASAYTLVLTVRSRIGSSAERSFTLVMDGYGPTVEIHPEIRGALTLVVGGGPNLINDNPVTVNCNIQVSTTSFAAYRIQEVRWFVEPAENVDLGNRDPTRLENSILANLDRFHANPRDPGGLDFFFAEHGNPRASGLVAYDTFKFDTTTVPDRQPMWLYVVAMDSVYNLGFAMQKIFVDQDTDRPVITIPGFDPGITSRDCLAVTAVPNFNPAAPEFDGNYPRQNVLLGGQGIELSVSDDDGVERNVESIQITLACLRDLDADGEPNVYGKLGSDELLATLSSGGARAWFGTLSQRTMAGVLFGAGTTHLPDGMYRLEITVYDNPDDKVQIGQNPPSPVSNSATFYFAVHTDIPVITVVSPRDGDFQYDGPAVVEGTVRSPSRLQSLWITFNPDVIDPPSPGGHHDVTLGDPDWCGNGMYYTYSWRKYVPTFVPVDTGGTDRPEFTLRAFNQLGFPALSVTQSVEIDVDPPDIIFTSFNQGRPINADENEFVVWGNVHFAVNVTDPRYIGRTELPSALPPGSLPELADVKWWLLPIGAGIPFWDDHGYTGFPAETERGTGGRFFYPIYPATSVASITFEAVFDSRKLYDDGVYKLYVIARDRLGNVSGAIRLPGATPNATIRVDQSADRPNLVRLAPAEDGYGIVPVRRPDAMGNLRITGLVRDADGFDPGRVMEVPIPGLDSHVQIRFHDPALGDGEDGWTENWIPVPGSVDGTGAIDFRFDVVTSFVGGVAVLNDGIPQAVRDRYRGNGLILYEIRVRDDDSDDTGRPRSKNPQLAIGYTFFTGDPANPLPSIAPAYVGEYRRVRSLIVDTIAPDIDGIPPRDPPGMFPSGGLLLGSLQYGTVTDANLAFLDISFGGTTHRLLGYRIPYYDGVHTWDWDMQAYVIGPPPFVAVNLGEALVAWFNAAGTSQGWHTVTFVAEDRAGNRSPSSNWEFVKDNQGPSLVLTGRMRAIAHNVMYGDRELGEDDFPDSWPLDWPHGDLWRTNSQWTDNFRATIADWPSDFAFLDGGAQAVLDAIGPERDRDPFILVDTEGTPPRISISGSFNDRFGTVWRDGGTSFQYRFGGGGRDDDTGWVTSEPALQGDNLEHAFPWTITRPLGDGEHSFDIRFSDTAGNYTEVFGIRFVVDTEAPVFFVGDLPDDADSPDRNNPDLFTVILGPDSERSFDGLELAADRRIFSIVDVADGGDRVFRLRGRVYEANLLGLTATIISGGADVPVSKTLPFEPLGEDGEWEWTLDIYEADVYAFGEGRVNISLVATDLASRNTVVEWPFFLDSSAPVVGFDLEHAFAPGPDIVLRGSAQDLTGIGYLRFVMARWDYQLGGWRWFNRDPVNRGWNLPAPPDTGDWNYAYVDPVTEDRTWVNWTVDIDMLRSSGYLLPTETLSYGQYRIDIFATDRSLDWRDRIDGNPYTGTYGTTDTAGAYLAQRFFVDDGDPVIAWPGGTERLFFNTNQGTANLRFDFTVGDPNTIAYFRAELRNAALPGGSFDVTNFATLDGSDWYYGTRSVELVLNDALLPGGSPLPTGEYTLFLTVRDAAGNTADLNHTRVFILGNTLPVPAVATPADLYEALSGPVTIQGMTTAGSGQIVDVRYALIPNPVIGVPVDTSAIFAYDNPIWRAGAWADNAANPLVRLEAGAGSSWTISIPNTRNIVTSDDHANTIAPVRPRDGITWEGGTINGPGANDPEGDIRLMRLVVRAQDEAGNVAFTDRDFWIFPEGDRPTIEIMSPPSGVVAGSNLLSGGFTITGMARDNERVQNVFFRVFIEDTAGAHTFNNRQYRLAVLNVPVFGASTIYGAEGANQLPRTTDFPAGGGWYMARSDTQWETSWSAPINAYGELEPDDRGRNRIFIQVLAKDAARLDPGGIEWDSDSPMISRLGSASAYVVSGAPIFGNQRVRRFTGEPGNWTPDGTWHSPGDVHMGGLGRATFRFEVGHEIGLNALRYRQTVYAAGLFTSTGTDIDLLAQTGWWSAGADCAYEGMNANPPRGSGLAIRAAGPSTTNSLSSADSGSTFMVWRENGDGEYLHPDLPGVPNERFATFTVPHGIGGISLGGVELVERTGEPTVYTVYVEVYTRLIPGMANRAVLYPLHITAVDVATPNPNTRTEVLRLPIDNSPPVARYELTADIAGAAATFGGSATAGPGDVGGVERVIVWFQSRAAAGFPSDGVSWYHWDSTFRWGDATSSHPAFVYVPAPTEANTNVMRRQNLPHIPAAGASSGGHSAIVINRNDPMRNAGIQYGNSVDGRGLATGWAPGGLGQVWNFTIDSSGIPSGPVDIHFVVFDRAGNASHHSHALTVMNNAPNIRDIRLATDLRGDAALQTALGTATYSNVLGEIRRLTTINEVGLPPEGDPTRAVETDIRRGISPVITPFTRTRSNVDTGARHVIGNFTARNNLMAISVETVARPHEALERTFRVEYVSGARLLTHPRYIMAGRVYIIEAASDVYWQALGAPHANILVPGYAFLATVNGADIDEWPSGAGNARVWELNYAFTDATPSGLRIEHDFEPIPEGDIGATRAEFVYRADAFTTGTTRINDFDGTATHADGTPWHLRESLFIVKVFDGPEWHRFSDFTLVSVRVNNNDRTPPFAQLYDLNPYAENLGRGDEAPPADLAPAGIGLNRTRGGLWRDANLGNLSRPGNIEPRSINGGHSLTRWQMGEVPGSPETVDFGRFFDYDTVSGRVVLRGYAEDDQRVNEVVIDIGGTRVPILSNRPHNATGTNYGAATGSAGLVQRATGRDDVFFFDSIDLYRHRVEWAFVWDTAEYPQTAGAPAVVGDFTVRAISYNAGTHALTLRQSPAIPEAAGQAVTSTDRFDPAVRNPGFPTNLPRYNSIPVRIRPYITGFRRDASQFFNNTRSMQGRYAFFRGGAGSGAQYINETVVVAGFNLGRAALTTTITLPTRADVGAAVTPANVTADAVSATQEGDFELTSAYASRYRVFVIPDNAVTGDGFVTLTVGTYPAVNTGAERLAANNNVQNRHLWHVQPWNTERSLDTPGSDLWNNMTAIHIWQSNDSREDEDQGSFPALGPATAGGPERDWIVYGASMSIDPRTGILHASHNTGGPGNSGQTHRSGNAALPAVTGAEPTLGTVPDSGSGEMIDGASGFAFSAIPSRNTRTVSVFSDPIINSSIFVDSNGEPWVVYSAIGRVGAENFMRSLGGVFVHGPMGAPYGWSFFRGRSSYPVESTWYQASNQAPMDGWGTGGGLATPPATNQFQNPRVVTHVAGGITHIHVSYFDSHTGTVKYRYNRRGYAGTSAAGHATRLAMGMGRVADTAAGGNAVRRLWTNLDGGVDYDDEVYTNLGDVTGFGWLNTIMGRLRAAAGTRTSRVVNHPTTRSPRVGEHNDIAVTSQGYPVVVYFDATSERLRMAISNNLTPIEGNHWAIITDVTDGDVRGRGLGHYVSMRIDTRVTPNVVHIAAFNNNITSLVYVRGTISGHDWTHEWTRIIDGVGNVGRRSSISLDDQGRPWIAFLDQGNVGSMDGVKVAFYNPDMFPRIHYDDEGGEITGWETMHVPARFRVHDSQNFRYTSQLGMENFPTRNVPPNTDASRFWRGAVGFVSNYPNSLFRIAYWVE